MRLDEYQEHSRKFAKYKDRDSTRGALFALLGLFGEAGELADHFKYITCDKDGKISEVDSSHLVYELGDILWYLANLSTELGISLEEVAKQNITKIEKRDKEAIRSVHN